MRLFWPTVDMLLDAPSWRPPEALRLPPEAFPSLGPLPSGPQTLDTSALEMSGAPGRGVVFQQGVAEPEIAVFAFDGGAWTAELTIVGPRPAALLFRGDVRLAGRIDARGAGSQAGGPGLGAWPGGGGGFGGAGGRSGAAGAGGAAQALKQTFDAGSGGQSGAALGGTGGGALQIGANGALELAAARITVDGRRGRPASGPSDAPDASGACGGGGGSGGAVVLHAAAVRLYRSTAILARGGAGGEGREGREGAHGGGGGGGGLVIGVTAAGGVFDPGGARFLVAGGPGGAAGPPGGPGADGAPGVVFLAARQPARRAASRSRRGRAAAAGLPIPRR